MNAECLPRLTVPDGMIEVTQEQFFKLLYADPRDIMPHNNRRDSTDWETKNRFRWGWTTPGWASPSGTPRVYAVCAAAAKGL